MELSSFLWIRIDRIYFLFIGSCGNVSAVSATSNAYQFEQYIPINLEFQ